MAITEAFDADFLQSGTEWEPAAGEQMRASLLATASILGGISSSLLNVGKKKNVRISC